MKCSSPQSPYHRIRSTRSKRALRVIPSSRYNLEPKQPSRRDLIRAGLRKRKFEVGDNK